MLGVAAALAVLSLVLLGVLGAPFLYAATFGCGGGATGNLLGTSLLLHSVGFGALARALWSCVSIGPFTYTTSAQQSRTPALAAAAASLLCFICGVAVLSAANAGPADGAEEAVVADDGSGGWHLEDHRVLGLWLGIAWFWDSAILLAAAFGVKEDPDDKARAAQRKKDEAKKKALVGALHVQALALCDLHKLAPTADSLAALDLAVSELHKWAAPTEHLKLTCRWHRAHGRHATALSVLTDSLAKEKTPPSKESIAQQLEIVEALGWRHWADAGKAALLVKFPAKYPPVFSRLD